MRPLSLVPSTDDEGVHDDPRLDTVQVNVGLPSPSRSSRRLYCVGSRATSAQTAALSCTGDYVTGRGWLDAFSTLSDLSGIETRYEPSGRQWAMRCGAQASDEAVTGFYLGALVISSGAWAVAQ